MSNANPYCPIITWNAATEVDECANDTCLNNGTCVDKVLGYLCNCAAGYTGTNCETGNVTSSMF